MMSNPCLTGFVEIGDDKIWLAGVTLDKRLTRDPQIEIPSLKTPFPFPFILLTL